MEINIDRNEMEQLCLWLAAAWHSDVSVLTKWHSYLKLPGPNGHADRLIKHHHHPFLSSTSVMLTAHVYRNSRSVTLRQVYSFWVWSGCLCYGRVSCWQPHCDRLCYIFLQQPWRSDPPDCFPCSLARRTSNPVNAALFSRSSLLSPLLLTLPPHHSTACMLQIITHSCLTDTILYQAVIWDRLQ